MGQCYCKSLKPRTRTRLSPSSTTRIPSTDGATGAVLSASISHRGERGRRARCCRSDGLQAAHRERSGRPQDGGEVGALFRRSLCGASYIDVVQSRACEPVPSTDRSTKRSSFRLPRINPSVDPFFASVPHHCPKSNGRVPVRDHRSEKGDRKG